tara:strand:- start:1075 stop:1371 length:297 start_codon:yes stop_codon:yes gene_type:complete
MDIINTDEDITSLLKDYNKKKKKYKTTPQLTKYEKTRILSERSSQINSGSTVLIANPERFDNAYLIALEEFKQNKIPFIIKRRYGNQYEYWKLKDLNY